MKSFIKLIRVAKIDSYENWEESMNQKIQEKNNQSQKNSDEKAERYKFLKNKAEEMQISIADYIEFFGSLDDKKNFGNIARQQSNLDKPEQSSDSIQNYNKVLEAFQFIKEKSEELNIPITRVWEDMQLPSEMKFKVHTLVVNYERLKNIEESRKTQNNQQNDSSLEERLKRSTENARFYSEQWNQVIEDAEKQNIDPIVYISAHYPDDLAQQIIAWYKIKTGEINATNVEEYFAQSVEQLSDQEVESFEQNYDDDAFQNFVDKAREIAENIDWEKAGAFLDEGKNRIIYQLLKPGSIIKKTTDAIKVVISMLSLKNVDEFNDQYYKDQEDRERAIQELDNYKVSKNMNKFQKLAQLNRDIELLEKAGKFQAADILQKKFVKEAQLKSAKDLMTEFNTLAQNPNQDFENLVKWWQTNNMNYSPDDQAYVNKTIQDRSKQRQMGTFSTTIQPQNPTLSSFETAIPAKQLNNDESTAPTVKENMDIQAKYRMTPQENAAENQLYSSTINEIKKLLATGNQIQRNYARGLYQETRTKFKNLKRQSLFDQQYSAIERNPNKKQ